jgi:hypothetical protein
MNLSLVGSILLCFGLIWAGCAPKAPSSSPFLESTNSDSNPTDPTQPRDPVPPNTQAAYAFSIPDEFTSIDGPGTAGRVTSVRVPNSESSRKMVMRAEIFHGGWHTYTDINGLLHHYHSLFWITRGTKWGSHVIGYLVAKTKGATIKLGTNIDVLPASAFTPGNSKKYGTFFAPFQWYEVEFIYDAPQKTITSILKNQSGDSWFVETPSPSPYTVLTNPFNTYNLHFGQSGSGLSGPDASTDGWKIRNVKFEFFK